MSTVLVTKILDLDGDLVLDLKASTGYRRTGELKRAGVTWQFGQNTSDYADGYDETTASKLGERVTVAIRVTAVSQLQLDAREQALLAAVAQSFLWVEGRLEDGHGVLRTYQASRANVQPSLTKADMALRQTIMTLDFQVQPDWATEVH